jgi:hypothetical protein
MVPYLGKRFVSRDGETLASTRFGDQHVFLNARMSLLWSERLLPIQKTERLTRSGSNAAQDGAACSLAGGEQLATSEASMAQQIQRMR